MSDELSKALLKGVQTKDRLPSGWTVKPLDADKAAEFSAYTKRMVEELKAKRGDYKPVVSTKQAESLSAIWDMKNNCLKEMTDEEILAHQNRPMPTKEQAQVWTSAEDAALKMEKDELRKESMDGLIIEEQRRSPRNEQGDAVSCGASAFSKELRINATEAFMETNAELSKVERAMLATAEPGTFKGYAIKDVEGRKRPLWRRILDARWISEPDKPPESLRGEYKK